MRCIDLTVKENNEDITIITTSKASCEVGITFIGVPCKANKQADMHDQDLNITLDEQQFIKIIDAIDTVYETSKYGFESSSFVGIRLQDKFYHATAKSIISKYGKIRINLEIENLDTGFEAIIRLDTYFNTDNIENIIGLLNTIAERQ